MAFARYTIWLPIATFAGYRKGDLLCFDAAGNAITYQLPDVPTSGGLRFNFFIDARSATDASITIKIKLKRAARRTGACSGSGCPAPGPATPPMPRWATAPPATDNGRGPRRPPPARQRHARLAPRHPRAPASARLAGERLGLPTRPHRACARAAPAPPPSARPASARRGRPSASASRSPVPRAAGRRRARPPHRQHPRP